MRIEVPLKYEKAFRSKLEDVEMSLKCAIAETTNPLLRGSYKEDLKFIRKILKLTK